MVYREFVTSDMSEPQLAQRIVAMTPKLERKSIIKHYITPPEVFGAKGSRNTVVDQMRPILREAKLPEPERADEDVVGGWRLVYNCLRRAKALPESGEITEEQLAEGPILLISKECPAVIKAIPVFIRDEDDSEVVDIRKMDAEAKDDTSDACGIALRILVKSMIDGRAIAPAAVRRRELWDSIEDPTHRAMELARFDARERSTIQVARRGRWR
jgi:TusA-related sulfurtransferase